MSEISEISLPQEQKTTVRAPGAADGRQEEEGMHTNSDDVNDVDDGADDD